MQKNVELIVIEVDAHRSANEIMILDFERKQPTTEQPVSDLNQNDNSIF